MRLRALSSILLCAAIGACATYREDLNRGQRLYEENQYEHALAIWRLLESDTDSLSFNDQARYSYLRGMTDYRLGFRPDARHWLALAKAIEQEHPGGLNPEWQERLTNRSTSSTRKSTAAARRQKRPRTSRPRTPV